MPGRDWEREAVARLGRAVFSLLGALGIGELPATGRRDVVTGLALVMVLALGAAFLSRTTEYEPVIYILLFGEALGMSDHRAAARRRPPATARHNAPAHLGHRKSMTERPAAR